MHVVRRDSLWSTVRNTAAFHYNSRLLQLKGRHRAARSSAATLQDVVEAFNARRVVLTVTAGRTGTDSISQLFKHLPDTHSSHEPNPNYRFILARVQNDPKAAARFFWYLQAPALIERHRSRVFESSHLFCKGLFEPCIAAGFRPSILNIRRDARAVALSLLRKNAVPGRTGAGRRYLISPNDETYLAVKDAASLSDYQLCYWYCLEIELRQNLYGEVAKSEGLRIASIQTSELNELHRLVEICVELGLATTDVAHEALLNAGVGTAHNASPAKKNIYDNFDLDAEEKDLRDKISNAADVQVVLERISEAKRLL